MFCTNCGSKIEGMMRFCTQCGAKVENLPGAVPAEEQKAVTEEVVEEVKQAEEQKAEEVAVPVEETPAPVAEPVAAEPVVVAESVAVEPAAAEPVVVAEPVAVEPAVAEPVVAEPAAAPAAPLSYSDRYAQMTGAGTFVAGQVAATDPAAIMAGIEKAHEETQSVKPVSAAKFFWLNILFLIPVIGVVFLIVFSCSSKNKTVANFAKAHLILCIIGAVLLAALAGYLLYIGFDFANIVDSYKDLVASISK